MDVNGPSGCVRWEESPSSSVPQVGQEWLALVAMPSPSYQVTKASLSVPFSLLHDTSVSYPVSLTRRAAKISRPWLGRRNSLATVVGTGERQLFLVAPGAYLASECWIITHSNRFPPLGFSIDSGKGLMRSEELSFVAGAPRANHKGAVVILRKDSASRLIPEVVLSGERLTSGFGYSLAVTDLNNDG